VKEGEVIYFRVYVGEDSMRENRVGHWHAWLIFELSIEDEARFAHSSVRGN
jgi:hypothetical protein